MKSVVIKKNKNLTKVGYIKFPFDFCLTLSDIAILNCMDECLNVAVIYSIHGVVQPFAVSRCDCSNITT